jgi:hypothetical protein
LELRLQVLFILTLIPEFSRQKIAEGERNCLVCVSRAGAGIPHPGTFLLREWLNFHSLKAPDGTLLIGFSIRNSLFAQVKKEHSSRLRPSLLHAHSHASVRIPHARTLAQI